MRGRNDVVRRCGDRGYGVERGVAGLHVPVPVRGPVPDHEGRPYARRRNRSMP